MKDDTGRPKTSRAGKGVISFKIVAPDTAPDWVKKQAKIYTDVLNDIQQRRQLTGLPTDASRH